MDVEMDQFGVSVFRSSEMHRLMKNSKYANVHFDMNPAVEVIEGHKQYGRGKNKHLVLRGLNMNVMRGEIYGLLGPSGCGKTTLLNIILGRLVLDEGDVNVFGYKPNDPRSGIPGARIGYMPQGLALYENFTIYETLLYFAMLFNLKRKYLKGRVAFLLDLLCLPSASRSVRSLSGGQQRRVSFAIAMLQEPQLLILDEPTVGVDPLLRQSIWRHLTSISRDGNTTIIVTTHYVDEAKHAHKVGMMRNGKLLAEEEPEALLSHFGANTLEDVFLNLAIKDDRLEETVSSIKEGKFSQSSSSMIPVLSSHGRLPEKNPSTMTLAGDIADPSAGAKGDKLENQATKPMSFFRRKVMPSSHRTVALIMKDTIRIYRNVGFIVFSFMIPSLQVCLFCLAIGGKPKNIPVALVNEEVPNGQPCTPEVIPQHLSCQYLKMIDKNINLIYFKDKASAFDAAKRGDVSGVLHFHKEFSQSLRERLTSLELESDVIEKSWVHASIDNTDQQTAHVLLTEFMNAYRDFVNDILSNLKINPKLTASPVFIDKPIFGQENMTFTMYMAPGVIISITYFLALGLTSLSTILERKEGLMDRSYMAGVNDVEIMLAHTVCYLFIIMVQIASVLLVMILGFGMPTKGSMALVILLTVMQGLCGMANGILISSFFNKEETAIQATLGMFYPTLLLSGILWPLSAMPSYLRYISYGLPQTLATEAMRGLLLRGWNMKNKRVWLGFVVTVSWTVFFHTISAIRLHFRR